MSAQQQPSAPPSRRSVFLWLAGVWIAGFLVLSCLTIIPVVVGGFRASNAVQEQQRNLERTATAQAEQRGGAGDGFGLPGVAQGDTAPAGDAAPAGDGFVPIQPPAAQGVTSVGVQQPTIPPAPTALPTLPPDSSTSMFGGQATATALPSATAAPSLAPPTSSPVIDLADAAPLPPFLFRQAVASRVDPDGQDGCGNPTSYAPELIADGNQATAWRVPGDGVGESVRLDLLGPFTVTEVRILAGYAKNDPCAQNVDRWPQGYRASVIDLVFSDGTSERRELADVRELQSLPLSRPVTTESVMVMIVQTRGPTASGAPRPYAAISEVQVIGVQP
jgi:hypothetical protein